MSDNITTSAVSAKEKSLILTIALILLAIAMLAIVGFLFLRQGPDTVQGIGDATEIRVSGKLPGRVVELYVQEGDRVNAGDTLVHIHSSLVDARLAQAEAMADVAGAANRKVDAGTRPQIVASARDLWIQAKAAADITAKTYQRMENLYGKGVISAQKRDEAKAAYDAATAAESAAKSQYDLAVAGAQSEDRQAAQAMAEAARSGVKEVDALLEDQYLVAPCDGLVTVIYPNVSELVAMGAPIMSIEKDDMWAVFNLRETMLKDITEGTKIHVRIPALEVEDSMTVYYIRDLGTYANWQASKSTGDFDARTFQVKARPSRHIDNFRPGMSVILLDK